MKNLIDSEIVQKSFKSNETKKEKNIQVQDLLNQLEKALESIKNEDSFKKYLKTMSLFPSYTMKNTLLIFSQFPTATYIAGFQTWKNVFGRTVKKGEKGIRILAPKIVQEDKNNEQEKKKVIVGYKTIYVFDISQTQGKELPTFSPIPLQGRQKDHEKIFQSLCALTTFKVVFQDLPEGCNGLTQYKKQEIHLSSQLANDQCIKTLIHEIAHSRLHNPIKNGFSLPSAIKEIQAESIAYVVCCWLGIDPSSFSLPYLALWDHQDQKAFQNSVEVIAMISTSLIEGLQACLHQRENIS